jgi:hypothetical protein
LGKLTHIAAATVGRAIAFLFILLGVWQMLSGNFGNGLWIAFIGWFLENAASAQIHQQMAHDLMADHQGSRGDESRLCRHLPLRVRCNIWWTSTFWGLGAGVLWLCQMIRPSAY